jgi:hypothetical protein
MTEHARPRRRRLSRRALRTWAWIAGGTALFVPLSALAAQPKVATAAGPSRPVVVHKILRRVIVVAPQANTSPPQIVYVGGGSSGGGTAAPVTTTGGSGVP